MNPLLGLRTPGSRHRERADRVIAREYEASRDTVLRVIGAKLRQIDITLDPRDLEAAYNQAWHALHQRLAAGAEVENRTGFLVTSAYRRAIDEHRAARPGRHQELPEDVPAVEADLAQQLDDRRRLRALRSGMRERLDDRELRAATLCYLHGCTRREAAEILGVSPRRMEKVMDRVSKRMAELAVDVEGDWCEQQRSLIQAYALGILDPDGERYPLAVAHLEDCSACRRRVLMLRGLAAVAPPVPLVLAGGAVVGGGATPTGDRAEAGSGASSAAGAAVTGAVAGAAGTGRIGAKGLAVAAAGVAAVVAVAVGVVLLADGDDRPATAVPPVTAPAAPADAPSDAATAAARERERERAAERRRARAARERAERRRAERRRAERARAQRAAASAAAAAPSNPGPATTPDPSTAPPAAASPESTAAPAPGAGSSGSSGSAASSGSSGSSGSGVVTDGAEEFDLGD
jgi:DNA-directed RNA polymerase specialized sigma24 family protein